jgi:low temperature requirement protein LtrA
LNTKPLLLMGMPMPARDPDESHRAATTLELFYDLVSVIAIAAAASLLHHGLANKHALEALGLFFMTFWSLWWAWMNFTWFASAYDTDDSLYRIAVFIQIVGALIMAAGIHQISTDMDFRVMFVGFVIMRMSHVSLWFRAASGDLSGRPAAVRYGTGVALCQVCWAVLVLVIPKSMLVTGFIIMMVFEHAEKAAATKWHRNHIIERYGLLTIIVLGESVLASYTGIQAIIAHFDVSLLTSLSGGLLILFTMWWLYFDEEEHRILSSLKGAFLWAYGHFAVLSSAAAVGAGLAVVTDQFQHDSQIGVTMANASVAIPAAVFLLALWFIHELPAQRSRQRLFQFPLAAALIIATPFFLHGVLLTGVIMVLLVILKSYTKQTKQKQVV